MENRETQTTMKYKAPNTLTNTISSPAGAEQILENRILSSCELGLLLILLGGVLVPFPFPVKKPLSSL